MLLGHCKEFAVGAKGDVGDCAIRPQGMEDGATATNRWANDMVM